MIQFLTRIPLPFNLNVTEEDFTEGVIYFPVVGALIGVLMMFVLKLTESFVSGLVLSVLLVTFQIFLTGGLHLDGLADSFDGLYSNRSKERVLEIMKDSRVGSNGALALIILILMKVALFSEIIYSYHRVAIIILTPAFARYTVIVASRISDYAREKGMGNFFIGKTKNDHLVMGTIFVLMMSLFNPTNLIALGAATVFAVLYSFHVKKKIGGMTGDTLGAMIEMSELVILTVFLFLR